MEFFYLFIGLGVLGLLIYQILSQKKTSDNELLKKTETEKNNLLEENARLKAEVEQKTREYGKIQNELERTKSEKDNFSGKNKELFVQSTNLQNEIKHVRQEAVDLKKKIADFEARETQRQTDFERKLQKSDEMRKAWEDEKTRIRREDEERQNQILEEKNRIWNDHETLVLAKLREVCEKPEIGFQTFDNQNLPTDFDGTLKPDFLVKFLDQYLIFDAKKSKSPQTYLNDQVKKTAKKCKANEKIYSTVFFVMPEDEISICKNLSFFEDGFSFFVIPISAIEAILANFRKITEYEKIKDFDPKDRENIVNMIANYDRHISFQNATNILLAKESVGLMNSKETLPNEFQSEINIRKQSMRNLKLKDSDLKKLSQNLETQMHEIQELTSPEAAIKTEELENAQDSLNI